MVTYFFILAVYLCLFLCGFFLLRVCLPAIGVLSACALSLHMGVGIWAVIWVAFNMLGVEGGYGWSSQINVFSVVLFLSLVLVLAVLFSIQRLRKQTNGNGVVLRDLQVPMVAIFIVGTYSILGYYFSANLWIVGDSYYFTFWSADPRGLLHNGFPLVNLSLAHLSTLASPNFYLSQLFPLMAIGLAIFVTDFAYRSLSSTEKRCDKYKEATAVLLALGFFVFASNSMFLMNSVYLNHHLLSAGLLALFGQTILLSSNPKGVTGYIFVVALLSVAVAITRMEGFIFALVFLAVLLAFQKDKRIGMMAFLAAGVAALPYLHWLTLVLDETSFVSAQQYLVMIFGYLSLGVAFALAAVLRLKPRSILLIGWLFVVIGVIFAAYSRQEHMLTNMYYFSKNTLNPAYWGALVWLTLFGLVGVVYARIRSAQGFVIRSHDAILHAVGLCLGIIILMTYFRSPLRYGETDSANRMLFHFLPLLWVYVQVELIGRIANFFSRPEPPLSSRMG